MELVGAAGGLVWRADGGELALVHRPRRADWSLPKGKLDPGETWHAAAVREVAEETGCSTRIVGFAGAKLFLSRPTPKLVLYWHMQVTGLGTPLSEDEVDEVRWLSPRRALLQLDHPSDRRLLQRTLAGRRSTEVEVRPPDGSASVRDLLVVDQPCSDASLAPWLRRIEEAVLRERRRRVGGARALAAS
jgi:8-oxo-dGTP diphosphatase